MVKYSTAGGIACALFSLVSGLGDFSSGKVNVLTYHNNLERTGLNADEVILRPANVNTNTFGKIFSYRVDGQIYGQPLYFSDVQIPGKGVRDVVYVATEHDSVFGFDANPDGSATGNPLWHASFIDPARGITTVLDEDVTGFASIAPEIGITSSPVIDSATGTLYVLAKTKEKSGGISRFVQRLHALDAATGAEKFGGPVVIEGTVSGIGDGTDGLGQVGFNAQRQLNRPGLLLSGGVVYACWASHGDTCPYHGWVIGYDALTLKQRAVFNSTPNGGLGGIWQAGGAPAVDSGGSIFVITGNGTFDGSSGGANYGDTFLKLTPALAIADFFTPYNQLALDSGDEDLGSSGPLVLPDEAGAGRLLLVGAGKEGTIYLLDRNKMGHFEENADGQIVQSLTKVIGPAFGSPAYFDHMIFYAGVNDNLKAFRVSGGLINAAPISLTAQKFGYPGGTPSISANGTEDGIVWLMERGDTAVLHAFEARDLSRELYNSAQAGSRDACGPAVKFAPPTVANGKVFVGTQDRLEIFANAELKGNRRAGGEKIAKAAKRATVSPEAPPPIFNPPGGPYPGAIDVSIANPADDTEVHYTLDGSEPADYSPMPSGPIRLEASSIIKAAAYNTKGRSATVSVTYDINELPATARFLTPDIATKGDWTGNYGAHGHYVIGDAPNYPGSAFVTTSNTSVFIASTVSSDVRALQKAFCPDERMVGTLYSADAFTVDLDLTHQESQQVTLYFWGEARVQSIEISDAWSGRLLDTRQMQNFGEGMYLGWELSGHVKLVITRKEGSNAVLNGIFFDPVGRRPRLRVQSTSTGALVSWSVARGEYELQRALMIDAPYVSFSHPTNTEQRIEISASRQFFRLASPP